MVCRTSHTKSFRLLMDFGADIQICDGCGRTPLHEACWAETPCFEIIEMILDVDKHMLFIKDSRGATPLAYVRRDNWTAFTKFLMSKKDKYWPDRDFAKLGFEEDPDIVQRRPNSRPVDNIRPDLSLRLVAGLADGSVSEKVFSDSLKSTKTAEDGFTEYSDYSDTSDELGRLHGEDSSEDYDDEGDCSDEYEDESDDEDEDDVSSVSSLVSFDDDDMREILESIGSNVPVRW